MMKLDSLKELKALIRLCKSEGIDSIKIDNIEFQVNLSTSKSTTKRQDKFVATPEMQSAFIPGGITEDTRIFSPDELTEEQLLFYSSGPDQQN